jgi:hypothetical protein
MRLKSASPDSASAISRFNPARPPIDNPLLPSSAYVRTISMPRRSAYSRILSDWLWVEYCWCSVDIRTYSAARSVFGGVVFGDVIESFTSFESWVAFWI